jgi:RNA polymerase sigma factor (sigma-70 family)
MASERELRLVAEHRSFLFAILTRHLGLSPADAEEVFQRFLIHLWEDDWRRLRSWSGRGTLKAYLSTMIRNLGRDYLRELSTDESLDGLQIPSDVFYRQDRTRRIRDAIACLSTRDQQLIHRRHELGESYKEIAEGLGMTVGHVGVALSRAEKRLRKLLLDGV